MFLSLCSFMLSKVLLPLWLDGTLERRGGAAIEQLFLFELSGLIRTCRELLGRNMRLKVEYGSRNTNAVAHAMAKSCRNNSTINVNEPSACIVSPSGLIEELYLKELVNTN
ncbi:hypothetical protein BVRB_3g069910 [Beta vulgaris subsp. vulgaris]|nr:hypothetical protein BVRB_3g069910 [Beta vulgaris subsp. vulgaris]